MRCKIQSEKLTLPPTLYYTSILVVKKDLGRASNSGKNGPQEMKVSTTKAEVAESILPCMLISQERKG